MASARDIDPRVGKSPGQDSIKAPRGRGCSVQAHLEDGLSAHLLVLEAGESIWALLRLRQRLIQDLKPVGFMELALADRIAGDLWRLRRVAILEAELMETNLGAVRESLRPILHFALEIESGLDEEDGLALKNMPKAKRNCLRLARHYTESCFPHQEGLDQLRRYEAHLTKDLYSALHELRRHQAGKRTQRERRGAPWCTRGSR